MRNPPVLQIDLLRQHSSLSAILNTARDALIEEVSWHPGRT